MCDVTGGQRLLRQPSSPLTSSAAALITPEAWTEFFGYRFRTSDHINVLELVALVPLLRRLSNQVLGVNVFSAASTRESQWVL